MGFSPVCGLGISKNCQMLSTVQYGFIPSGIAFVPFLCWVEHSRRLNSCMKVTGDVMRLARCSTLRVTVMCAHQHPWYSNSV